MELQIILNTFASDIFRRQADLDYIAARANYRMQLRQQFLWAAQQSLEKYLKAILLFNGKSARYGAGRKREFGHDLTRLVEEVKTIAIFEFELEPEQERFVAYLAQQGPNRYLGTTAYNTRDVLHQLDATVWQIRRYCQYMPDRPLGSQVPMAGIREASVRSALAPAHKDKPHLFGLFNGDLETVVKRPASDPARRALIWANFYYGARRRTSVTLRTFSSSEIPPHERSWAMHVDWKEIEAYVKL